MSHNEHHASFRQRLLGKEVFAPRSIPLFNPQSGAIEKIPYEAFHAHFHVNWTDELFFSNPSILDWTFRQAIKRLTHRDTAQENRWILSLFETDLLNGKRAPLYLKWINAFVGYGVFAGKTLPPLTFVGQYVGIVRRRSFLRDRRNDYIFGYNIGPSHTPYIIDASEWGNMTRFLNHSDTPNLTSHWVIYEGVGRVLFFTKKAIKQHEQLTYDYGPLYWKRRSAPLEL